MAHKYIICCDFDGVLHSYTSGWKGPTVIPDPPVPGAMSWLDLMTQDGNYDKFEIAVYSSRSKEPGGIEAMQAWLRAYFLIYLARDGMFQIAVGEPVTDLAPVKMAAVDLLMNRLTFPTQKPSASMTIDDRAFHFQGIFPTVEWLLGFKPWNKLVDTRSWLDPRPSAERLAEIRRAYEEVREEAKAVSYMDSSDAVVGELLAEIDHIKASHNYRGNE